MEAGEILVKSGLLDRQQLERSRTQANGHCDGLRLIESAVNLGFVSEEQALKAVGKAVGLEYIDLAEANVELPSDSETEGSELCEMAQEASVVRLVNEILLEAIETRASDVHIESQPSGIAIRYRIDGMLQHQPVPGEINRFQAAIISR